MAGLSDKQDRVIVYRQLKCLERIHPVLNLIGRYSVSAFLIGSGQSCIEVPAGLARDPGIAIRSYRTMSLALSLWDSRDEVSHASVTFAIAFSGETDPIVE